MSEELPQFFFIIIQKQVYGIFNFSYGNTLHIKNFRRYPHGS